VSEAGVSVDKTYSKFHKSTKTASDVQNKSWHVQATRSEN